MLSPIWHPILKHYTLFHLWKLNFFTNILCSEWHLVWVQIHPFFHLWKWEILRKIFGLKWHLIWVQIHQLLLAKTCVFAQHIGSKMVSHKGARTPFSNFWKRIFFSTNLNPKWSLMWVKDFPFSLLKADVFAQNIESKMRPRICAKTHNFQMWKRVFIPKLIWVPKHPFSTCESAYLAQ